MYYHARDNNTGRMYSEPQTKLHTGKAETVTVTVIYFFNILFPYKFYNNQESWVVLVKLLSSRPS